MCLLIPNIIGYLFFRKTAEYQYCKSLVVGILQKDEKSDVKNIN